MTKSLKIFLWVLAVVITLLAVLFQRMTGPTHPKKVKFEVNGATYKTTLPRSLTTPIKTNDELQKAADLGRVSELSFKINGLSESTIVSVSYRPYRSAGEWKTATTTRQGSKFTAALPAVPAAAKLEYYLMIYDNGKQYTLEPVVVRFKNDVSPLLLIPHILLMFTAMLFSTLAGLMAMNRLDAFYRYAKVALICLGVGGLIFGCLVQKQAFGAYWTGWPFGKDLTDNKTLLSFIVWLVVILLSRKKLRYKGAVVAAVFMLLVYCIPHSTLGSEYDYASGTVKTGITE